MSGNDLSSYRQNYIKGELTEDKIATNPFEQFHEWFSEAKDSAIQEPNAMVLATADVEGRPTARIVLLKGYNEDGFIFFTNYKSRKGNNLAQNNAASLLFYWDILEKQVRIEGTVEKVEPQVSEDYFNQRPLDSRLSAIISNQSTVIPSRKFLEEKLEELRKTNEAKRPENWGGYILKPTYFEFWQGRANRLHDRISYTHDKGGWKIERLAP